MPLPLSQRRKSVLILTTFRAQLQMGGVDTPKGRFGDFA
jgi:hypothetical protein